MDPFDRLSLIDKVLTEITDMDMEAKAPAPKPAPVSVESRPKRRRLGTPEEGQKPPTRDELPGPSKNYPLLARPSRKVDNALKRGAEIGGTVADYAGTAAALGALIFPEPASSGVGAAALAPKLQRIRTYLGAANRVAPRPGSPAANLGRQLVGRTQYQLSQQSPSTIRKTADTVGRFTGLTPGTSTTSKVISGTLYGTGTHRDVLGVGGESTPFSDVYSAVRNRLDQDAKTRQNSENSQQKANPAVDAIKRALDRERERRKNQ